MSASKAPAYFSLVVAVAAGVLISGANRNTSSGPAPSVDAASAPSASAPQKLETKTASAMEWKTQVLNIGAVRFKSMLPLASGDAKCIAPGPADDEVGLCQPAVADNNELMWQIRIVTQRDRFVPVSWFSHAVQTLRALQSGGVTRQLGNEANLVTKAGFNNAALLAPAQLAGALAIQGAASGPSPSSTGGEMQSCVYAFFLLANRPTTLLACAKTEDESLAGAQKIVSSLLKLNPSVEYKRGSAQAIEHSLYLKRLKAAGGPAAAPELATSEQTYEQTVADECSKYPLISQERFQCFEGFAANRFSSL